MKKNCLEGIELFDFSQEKMQSHVEHGPGRVTPLVTNTPKKMSKIDSVTDNTSPKNTETIKYHCEICNINLNSQIVYDQHLIGQKHLKKATQAKDEKTEKKSSDKISLKCDICQINNLSKYTHGQHLVGQRHIKKLAELSNNGKSSVVISSKTEVISSCEPAIASSTLTSIPIVNDSNNTTVAKPLAKPLNNDFKCELCNVAVPTNDQLNIHLGGKKHLMKTSFSKGDKPVKTKKENIKKEKEKVITVDTDIKMVDFSAKSSEPPGKQVKVIEKFKCDVCDLDLVSKDQLIIHESGKKHAKKLNALKGVSQPEMKNSMETENNKNKKQTEEEKFAHLNIAWDKYKIDNQTIPNLEMKSTKGEQYEFFCALCNKYMQRKIQLVDHLKSQKHHRKIYEKRIGENKETMPKPALSKRQVKKGLNKRQIEFTSESQNQTKFVNKFINKNPRNQGNNINPNPIQPRFQNYNNSIGNSTFQNQEQSQNYSNYGQAQSSIGQASFKAGPIQYNQYGSIKRKSPGIVDNNSNFNANMDTKKKFRKHNDSMGALNNNNNNNQQQANNFNYQNSMHQGNINQQSYNNKNSGQSGAWPLNNMENFSNDSQSMPFNLFSSLPYMQYSDSQPSNSNLQN